MATRFAVLPFYFSALSSVCFFTQIHSTRRERERERENKNAAEGSGFHASLRFSASFARRQTYASVVRPFVCSCVSSDIKSTKPDAGSRNPSPTFDLSTRTSSSSSSAFSLGEWLLLRNKLFLLTKWSSAKLLRRVLGRYVYLAHIRANNFLLPPSIFCCFINGPLHSLHLHRSERPRDGWIELCNAVLLFPPVTRVNNLS